MTRAVQLLATAACAFALACGHEVSAPSSAPSSPPDVPAPAARDATRAPDAGSACVEIDDVRGGKHITLEGRLFVDQQHEHPTRGKTHPYILHLDEPRCAIGSDEPSVTELHLASESIELKSLVGKHVRVSGDPFGAHTAWHARPILLMTTKATALP